MFPVDLEQQSWFIVQAISLGFAAGAERISVYKLVDIHLPPGGESFGILRPDLSRRPAFEAYAKTIELLSGFQDVYLQEDEEFFVVTFYRSGQVVRVLWSRNDKANTVALPAINQRAQLHAPTGGSSSLVSPGGFHRIELSGARCRGECIIGGSPQFLVEEALNRPDFEDMLAIPSENIAPEAMMTATATTTPTVTPIPTPTPAATKTPLPTVTSTPTATVWPTATTLPSTSATAADTGTERDDNPESGLTKGDSGQRSNKEPGEQYSRKAVIVGLTASGTLALFLSFLIIYRSRTKE